MFTFRPRTYFLSTVMILLCVGIVVFAQHDSGGVTGGGMIGGSTTRTSTKPAGTTTAPRKRPTPATTTKPTPARTTSDTKTPTADFYYQQGETLYNAKKYKDALESYLKATQINPSMASALYRIGWIYNDL